MRQRRSAPGFVGYQFGLADEQVEPVQQPLDDLPATDAAGKAKFSVDPDKLPSTTHPLQAQIAVRMAEPGGRAVEHTLALPVTPSGNMIGIKPLSSGRSLADGADATFAVVVAEPGGAALAQSGLHYELLRIDTHYQFYKRDGQWNFEPVKTTTRVADGSVATAPEIRPHRAAGTFRPLPAAGCHVRSERSGEFGRFRRRLVRRCERRHARHARSRARQAGI